MFRSSAACVVVLGVTIALMPAARSRAESASRADPKSALVIPNCKLIAVDRQMVSSQREGRLLVLGTELRPGEPAPPADRLVTVELGVLAIEPKQGEKVPDDQAVTVKDDPRKLRLWKEGDALDTGKLVIARISRTYRRLEVGDEVRAGQALALLDPTLAVNDLIIRKAKLDAAVAECQAAEKIREEARRIFETTEQLFSRRAASREELDRARLTWERYQCEEMAARQKILLAERELSQMQTLLAMHEIRSAVPGVVRDIFKGRGEGVSPLEPILEIRDPRSLRLEGLVDVQHVPHLRKGQEVIVEPTRAVRPLRVLRGHLQEITGVAVSKGRLPLIVSASEDRTVRVWDAETGTRRATLRHSAPVRSVACTPPGVSKDLCLSGAADGTIRLWDLAAPSQPLREFSSRHKAAVLCTAFSPDGETCATGGEDHTLCLWKTATGERLSQVANAHKGAVTWLQFASATCLVSAGRDHRLRVWTLRPGSPPEPAADLDGRGSDVGTLGISPDGRRVLFDHGPELRVLSLAENETEAVFANTTRDLSFTTLAVFSPDGRVILTGGAPEGGLQLWRAPTETRPAGELCRLHWAGAHATCGAFAAEAPFVVSGTRDRNVLVWGMPSAEEVEARLTARITLIEPFLSAATGQARVWAELTNPGHLIPGNTATMIVPPGR